MAAHPKPFPPLEGLPKKTVVKKQRVAPVKVGTRLRIRREPIAAAKAKTHLLQLLDDVERSREPITITKRGRVVAQLVPAPQQLEVSAFDQIFGRSKGKITILDDIVSPDWESWGPEWR